MFVLRAWRMVLATLLMGLAACTADADAGADALDDDVVDELRAVIPGAEMQIGGTDAWIDTPTDDLALAAGQADIAAGEDLTGDHAFRIASITKVFTATVALQLVEEGRLDLEEPIAELVPEQADRFEHGDEITLRHLLGHTSGLPDYARTPRFIEDRVNAASIDDGPPAAVVTAPCPDADRDWLGYATGQPPSFAPGENGQYSNTNYLLAGR